MTTCIYCIKDFTDAPPEHFLPQLIGGRDKIFCVCKKCNHNLGSTVDSRIRENVQLSMKIDSSTLKRSMELKTASGFERRKVKITNGTNNKFEYDNRSKNGPIMFESIKMTISPEEDQKLYKVFAKTLLGSIAFLYGPDEALKYQYNPLREFVMSDGIGMPSLIEIKQMSTLFSRDESAERIKKIQFYWDINYDECTEQVKMNTLEVPTDLETSKGGLCNFISLSKYNDSSVIGTVTFLETKSVMLTLKNCTISENKLYLQTFLRKNQC